VRVVGSDGQQLGVMKTRDALDKAQEEGLDLVEVAPTENPPVCRILDFGKYLYDEKKKRRESKKKQIRVEVKECKFRPKIGDHDFDVRIRRAVKFLEKGNKVKLTVMFRGREHAHPEVAERLILRAFEELNDLGKMEAPPRKEGRDMHTLIAPLPEAIRKKAMKARQAGPKAADRAVVVKPVATVRTAPPPVEEEPEEKLKDEINEPEEKGVELEDEEDEDEDELDEEESQLAVEENK